MAQRSSLLSCLTFATLLFLGGCGPAVFTPGKTICTTLQDCPGRLICKQGQCIDPRNEVSPESSPENDERIEPAVEKMPDAPSEVHSEISAEKKPDDAGPEALPEPSPETTCQDEDKDGYCANIPGVKGELDCNDKDKEIHPNAPERCNGQDDDCDGSIDEGLTPPPCSKSQGVCNGAKKTCKGEKGWADCTESDYLVHSGDYETQETTCDGKDNDCDGKIDEDAKLPTTPCQAPQKLGECARGVFTGCQGGKLICTSKTSPLPNEICGNGKDDDCDGNVDENPPCACTAGSTESCYTGLTGCTRQANGSYACQGECATGKKTCQANNNWGPCLGQTLEAAESCDGKDNNCDGKIDENNPEGNKNCTSNTPGICQDGRTQCVNAKLVCQPLLSPTTETCNGKDDNCDGSVDNNTQEEGKPCVAQALGSCKDGAFSCEQGTLRCIPAPPVRETCNGKDDDCDGITDNTEGTNDPLLRPCYGGPANTNGIGICIDGTQRCLNGSWSSCGGSTTPMSKEICDNKLDDNCNHSQTEGCTTCNPSRIGESLTSYGEHEQAIYASALSLDNKYYATASKNGDIRVWLRSDGQQNHSFHAHNEAILDLAISSDNKALASASEDKLAKVWEISSGQLRFTLRGNTGSISGIRFVENNQRILTVSRDGYLHSYDATDGTLHSRLKIGFNAQSLVVHPTLPVIAIGGQNGDIQLFDLTTHKTTKQWSAHSGSVRSLAFSTDGKELASGSSDKIVYVWETSSNLGKKLYTLSGLQGDVNSVLYDPQKRFFFAGTAAKVVRAWRLPLYTYAHAYTAPTGEITSIQVESGGATIYATTNTPRTYTWPIASPTASARPFPAHNSNITALAQYPNASLFASGDDRGTIVLWKKGTRLQPNSILAKHNATISRLGFNADGKRLISTSRDGDILVWDTAAKTPQATFTSAHLGKAVIALATHPTNPAIFVSGGEDSRIVIWDVSKNKEVAKLTLSNNDLPLDLHYTEDGRYIAAGGKSGSVYILTFDGITLKLDKTLNEHQNSVLAVAFSPKPPVGAMILASSDVGGRIILWSLGIWRKENDFSKTNARYSRLQFALTPQYLFAQSDNFNQIDVWDVPNRRQVNNLKPNQSLHSFLWDPTQFTLWAGSDAILYRWTCP